MSNLMMHAGGTYATREDLKQIILPPATKTWKPISHLHVLSTALMALDDAGYAVKEEKLGVSKDGHRFFGTLDLTAKLGDGISLAVGLRNSIDKSFPMGFCAGSRVFVCDNLAFSADLMIKRKHTRNGSRRFADAIADATLLLSQFEQTETNRIAAMQSRMISDAEAESIMLRAAIQRGIVAQHDLADVFKEYHEPRHEEFRPRTAWSLLNAFTEVMRNMQVRNPAELARRTMRLQAMLTSDRVPTLAA